MTGSGGAWEALVPAERLRRLNIDARGAHVDVHGWSTAAVHVLARRRSGEPFDPAGVHVRRSPGRVYVEVERGRWPFSPGDLELLISAPQDAEVTIDQSNGGVHVTGMQGRLSIDAQSGPVRVTGGESVNVDTAGGPVEVRHVHGRVYIDTAGGGVFVEDAGGPVVVDTAAGPVRAVGIMGSLRIDTGTGSVYVERARGDIMIDTGHGDVRLVDIFSPRIYVDAGGGNTTGEFAVLENGYYRFESTSGEIRLYLPAGSSCEIAAETGHGTVRSNLPLRVHLQRPHQLRGILGSGRAVVRIESARGDIVLGQRREAGAARSEDIAEANRGHRRRQAELAILQLVAEGKAEPEEAVRLLTALEDDHTGKG